MENSIENATITVKQSKRPKFMDVIIPKKSDGHVDGKRILERLCCGGLGMLTLLGSSMIACAVKDGKNGKPVQNCAPQSSVEQPE